MYKGSGVLLRGFRALGVYNRGLGFRDVSGV